MEIPQYPDFAPIDFAMRESLYPALNLNKDGISEFTFSNLYLFRRTYGYKVARFGEHGLIISGSKNGKSFFSAPCCFPDSGLFDDLMRNHDFMKNMSESQVNQHRIELEGKGYLVGEDRDNFDYLYYRKDLAELSGREYHKKRNLVNGFISTYECEQRPLTKENATEALKVLDEWRTAKGADGDYQSAREGIELFCDLELRGAVYYIEKMPVGWCLGEPLAKGTMFAIHFEKALDQYKGVYQFINQAFAQSLPAYFKVINREQDLGEEGLRQAKMTYRPFGFAKKYRVMRPDTAGFVPHEVSQPAECGPGIDHD
ncbi:MAG: phosphatidylglycerol lysyltransferase domain-containing protein [Spirochaetaceae bacterium]|nr:phosphatidylglycerol lysyltransferase domain-containing protein [Spirochaetaceae bacterium]